MLKKILLLFLLSFSTYAFCQKNDILISPSSMIANSAIIISAKEKGNYTLIIKRKDNDEILFSKNIFIQKRNGFKHDFSAYANGKYFFIIKKDDKEVFKVLKTK